jgi:hypothetical protein
MGWNSWDAYGLTITEPQFRDNVSVLAKTLKPFGWQYAVIDEGWFLKNPKDLKSSEKVVYEVDANGRYNPVPERFPSALVDGKNQGFRALGAYVHAQGLKFGIHIVRGIPREAVKQNLPVANSRFRARDVADTSDPCPWDPTNWGVRDTPAGSQPLARSNISGNRAGTHPLRTDVAHLRRRLGLLEECETCSTQRARSV